MLWWIETKRKLHHHWSQKGISIRWDIAVSVIIVPSVQTYTFENLRKFWKGGGIRVRPTCCWGLSRYRVMVHSPGVSLLEITTFGLATEAKKTDYCSPKPHQFSPLISVCCILYHSSNVIIVFNFLGFKNNWSTQCLGYWSITTPTLVAFHVSIVWPFFVLSSHWYATST